MEAKELIGRHQEQQVLQQCMKSDRSELVVIYGRRRIGKTFLVRKFFNDNYDFHFVGHHNFTRAQQLERFATALQKYSRSTYKPVLKNWIEAFDALQDLLEHSHNRGKKVIFIDELPWMDTQKSDLVAALEGFWNSWVASRDDIVLVTCGSATSWMTSKVLHNQGGLFGRVTRQIYLRPFNLAETEEYLDSRHFGWDRFQIAQCYMVLGGVPYYLTMLDAAKSLVQNIDQMFFSSDNAAMRVEYNELYSTLFRKPEQYLTIIKLLCTRREGFTRQEIMHTTKIGGSVLTHLLDDLQRCDFIFSYSKFGNRSNGAIFRIKDFYTLFYYKFIYGQKTRDRELWSHIYSSPQVSSWQGFSFELLCLLHLDQIKRALGIDRILNSSSAWRSKSGDTHTQIDLVIERGDRIINLCEMKFSRDLYAITKDYEDHLRKRNAIFRAETQTRLGIQLTFITSFGLLQNKHSGMANSQVTLQDLFAPTNN